VVLFGILLFALLGFLRGQSLIDLFVTATALVVSAIPEGLLPAVTIVMIFGVRRLAQKKALVRRLGVTETIGAISVICTDKTGTLTTGQMRVSHVLTGTNELFENHTKNEQHITTSPIHLRALEIGGIVNDAFVQNPHEELEKWSLQGRPTDQALLLAALQAGIDVEKMTQKHKRLARIPFSSARKFAAHVYANATTQTATLFVLGAPEIILRDAEHVMLDADTTTALTKKKREQLHARLEELTRQGLRVVACAQKTLQRNELKKKDTSYIKELSLVGFIAIKDPVRDDVKTSLARAKKAGIRPLIITGDHAQTAVAIIRALDWYVAPEHICTGKELEEMSASALQKAVEHMIIFARVSPEHKIRIVHALQERGEIVAMVGDGVNDAPALKAAHVGISMGGGADLTKSVADIVLLDSSFTTIIDAVEQGRVLFDNIRRIIIYLLADDFSELFLFFVAMLFGLPLPLVAAQILWINLVEDSFPNIALTTEQDTKGIMDVPPRKQNEPIIAPSYKKFMFVIFVVSGIAAVGLFLGTLFLTQNLALAQTSTFILIAVDSLAMVYVLRSFRRSIFRRDIFANHYINWAVLFSLFLLVLALLFAPLRSILHTTVLSPMVWLLIGGITFAEILIIEYAKKHFFFAHKY